MDDMTEVLSGGRTGSSIDIVGAGTRFSRWQCPEPVAAGGRGTGRPRTTPSTRAAPSRRVRNNPGGPMPVPPQIRAVVFDAVGTLIHPEPSAAAVYTAFGRQFGSCLGREE